MQRSRFLLLSAFLLTACSGGSDGPANIAPTVLVTQPSAPVQVADDQPVEVRWIANDPDDVATTDVVAVPLSGGAEIAILLGEPEQDGVEQSVEWMPSGVQGLYRIEARTTDGVTTVVGVASGSVTVGDAPQLDPGAVALTHGGGIEALAAQADGSYAVACRFLDNFEFAYLDTGGSPLEPETLSSDAFVAFHAPDGAFLGSARTHADEGFAEGEQGGAATRDLSAMGGGGFVASIAHAGEVTVGLGEPNEATHVSAGFGDNGLFVGYDSFGQVLWSRKPVVGYHDVGDFETATTPTGFAAIMDLDEGSTIGPGDAASVTFAEYPEYVLSGWDSSGTLQFAIPCADVALNGGMDDVILAGGPTGLTVVGQFYDVVTFGPGTPQETTLVSATNDTDDLFVARYGHDGTFRWAARIGAALPQETEIDPYDVVELVDGSCRVLFEFDDEGTYVIGEGSPNQELVVVGPDEEGDVLYVVAYDANGTYQWAMRVDGEPENDGHLVPLAGGDMALAMTFGDEITLTPPSASESPVTHFAELPPGMGDLLIAHVTSVGDVTWSLHDGGPEEIDLAAGVAVPGSEGLQLLLVASSWIDDVELGTNSAETTVLTNPGDGYMGFRAVYGPNGEL